MIDADVERAPFLRLRAVDGRVEQRGLATCRLGTPLDFGRATPDGVFAEWTWDGARLLVRNDRYGLHPLFYFAAGGEFGISPSIPRLLLEGAPAELDEPALAVFFRTGFYVGEDTPFRVIRAVPPSATLEWSDGRLRVAGERPTPKGQSISRPEARDRYIALFREAVRRRLPDGGEYVMPLSGGRDSRHILLEACEAGCRPRFCLTVRHHPPRMDEDAELAAWVAEALGLEQVLLDQTEPRLPAELRKNVKTSFGSDEGTAFMVLGDYLDGRTRVIFDGIGGDFLSSGRFLTERRVAMVEEGRLADLADDLLWKQPRVPALLGDEWRPRLDRRAAIRRLQAELERHADAPNPITSFIFWNRCRREIALFPFNFYPEAIEKICPYLDHDVFDFLMSLPPAVVLDRTFHAEAIQRAFPAYAHIPFEPQGSPFRFDDAYRRDLLALIADVGAYLEQEPPRLLSAQKVRERLARHAQAGREPVQFSPHLIYALQLERFITQLPGSP
jgi:asparagine synthase (glutamine-hydrolysing)